MVWEVSANALSVVCSSGSSSSNNDSQVGVGVVVVVVVVEVVVVIVREEGRNVGTHCGWLQGRYTEGMWYGDTWVGW